MHTINQVKALQRARVAVLGLTTEELKREAKTVPAYDLSMVRRLDAGKASGVSLRKGAGAAPGAALAPGNAERVRSALVYAPQEDRLLPRGQHGR